MNTTTKMWTREGYPRLYLKQRELLEALREAKRNGYPFIHVHADKRTLRYCQQHDWIMVSPGLDGERVTITSRGETVLAVYETPKRRSDGLCPACGERPRYTARTGKRAPYCRECSQQQGRDEYAKFGRRFKPDGVCPRCKKNPRHVSKNGKMIAYCTKCRHALRKSERASRHARLLARIQAGEYVACLKCDQPRYHTDKLVYDYCYAHYREYQTEYNRKRKIERDNRAAIAYRRKHKICPRCKVNPRWQYSTGRLDAHCRDCHLEMKAQSYKAQKQRVFRIITGQRTGKGVAA